MTDRHRDEELNRPAQDLNGPGPTARLAALIKDPPRPPGPFRPTFWRSPIRGPWLTAVFGLV
ncbi:hypothetical protein, partial [Kitasatospora sp. NPDC094015]|uniref:hypothetical protein n=1 Tax=Kitasatospora sp. NPDC094015 TaxID=3155205 RepID=UPI00331C844D